MGRGNPLFLLFLVAEFSILCFAENPKYLALLSVCCLHSFLRVELSSDAFTKSMTFRRTRTKRARGGGVGGRGSRLDNCRGRAAL